MQALVPLHARPVTALFQPADGMLRRVMLGEIDVDWETTTPWTPLGLQVSGEGHSLSHIERKLLRRLQLDHLRIDIDLDSAAWEQTLAHGLNECQEISCRPLLAVTLTDGLIHRLQTLKRILPDDADTIVIFHRQEKVTPERLLEQAERLLHRPVAGGERTPISRS